MTIRPNPSAYALRGLDRQQAGMYAPNAAPWCASASVALVANRGYAVRFVAEKSITITQIGFVLSVAAGANDNCDVGIFDSAMATLIGSAGSTAGKLNGAPGPVSVPLAAGANIRQGKVYYACFSSGAQGGTAASVSMTSFLALAQLGIMFGAGFPARELAFNAAEFPLAAPFTSAGNIANCPILALLQ